MFLRTPGKTSLVALALLSACAKNGASKDPLMGAVSGPARGVLGSTCSQASDCSPSVALLSIQDGDDVRECVGSLIADNLIVTASHCLPENLRHAGAQCKQAVRASFPATEDYASLQAECQDVVSASAFSDRTVAQQDYAVLRLSASTSRPVFKLDHSGFQADASYRVIRSEDGKFSSQKCRALRRTEALPGSDQAESSVMAIADCEIDTDSEGAPLIDSAGNLHGILQSVVPASRIVRRVSPHPIPESGISTISYATNFSCVRFPLDDENLAFPSACQIDPNLPNPLTEKDKSQTLISESIQVTDSRFQWPNLSSDLQWGTRAYYSTSTEGQAIARALGWSTSSISIFTIPFPKCVAANAALAATTFKLPVVGYEFALDRYLMLGLDRGKSLDTIRARYQVDLPRLRWNGVASSLSKHISLFVDTGSDDWTRIASAPLPNCSQSDSNSINAPATRE